MTLRKWVVFFPVIALFMLSLALDALDTVICDAGNWLCRWSDGSDR